MSSINQLVSEIAHSVQQADSVPVRRAIKLGIVHARAELIRKTFADHNYTDKVLRQRFRLKLIDVNDGDVEFANTKVKTNKIKRTESLVPRPIRLDNNLPFHSIRTAGVTNPVVVAFVGEGVAKFYRHLPGMKCAPTYDYLNGYIYLNNFPNNVNYIVVESVFEYPNGAMKIEDINDDDEFFVSEDFHDSIKKLVLETLNANVVRDTNEVPNANLIK